jgi:hypothetical protein
MQHHPDCLNCKHNTSETCEQGVNRYPHAYECTAYIRKDGITYTPPTRGEFKVMSEAMPTKCIKYALLP